MSLDSFLKKKFSKYYDFKKKSYLLLKTNNSFNISNAKNFNLLINLELVNNIRWINKFHELVN